MPVNINLRISDRAWNSMARAAREHGISLPEHLRLVIEADARVYDVEDSDGRPAGPIATELRPRKWREVTIIHDVAPVRSVTASFFGDPPPGRSALDQKKVQHERA